MSSSSSFTEKALKVFIDKYIDYLKFFDPDLSEQKIKDEVDCFTDIFLSFLDEYPYRATLYNENYLESAAASVFKYLKKLPEVKPGHAVVKKLLNTCFTTDIKPKRLKTAKFLTYAPIINVACSLFNVVFGVIYWFVKCKYGF